MSTVRFVALGDSITVGLGDPMPDRTWRGLTARLDQRITADIRSTIEAIEGGPDAELEIAAV